MRIDIDVKNILGVKRAQMELGHDTKGAIVYGKNVSGKTSLQTAIAAAMSGEGNFLGLPAARKSLYAHNGVTDAKASVEVQAVGETFIYQGQWDVHKGHSVTVGSPYMRAPLSFDDPIWWEPKHYRELFAKASISEKLFTRAMRTALGYGEGDALSAAHEEMVRTIHAQVVRDGVPAVVVSNKEQAIRRKRDWEREVASVGENERFGKKKAAEWRPRGWYPELEGMSMQTAHDNESTARLAADESKRLLYIGEEDARRMEESVAGRSSVEESLETAKMALRDHAEAGKNLWEQRSENRKKHAALPKRWREDKKVKCPKCKADLILGGHNEDILMVPKKRQNEEELEQADRERKALDKEHDDLSRRIDQNEIDGKKINERVLTLKAELRRIDDAKRTLAARPSAEEAKQSEQARAALERAVRATAMVRAHLMADEARESIARHEQIIDALSEGGPVSQELARVGIGGLAEMVGLVSGKLGVDDISFDDGVLTVGGRPVRLLATNECFMARLVMMVSLALMFRQPLVMVDNLDVVVSAERREAVNRLLNEWKPVGTKLLFFQASNSAPASTAAYPVFHMTPDGVLAQE